MKVIAAIQVDLEVTAPGTVCRLSNELLGVPVLRRTVDRVLQAQRPAGVYVVCPTSQQERCKSLLGDTKAILHTTDAAPPPYRRLTRTARKWSLDAWRGGMGSAAYMDEHAHSSALALLARATKADAVWVCPGAAVLVDPHLIDAMIDHYEASAQEMRMTFAPGPPGLTGTVYAAELLAELARENIPPGWVNAYKPDAPRMDLAFKECCYPVSEAVRYASGRLVVDTRRAFETADALLREHANPDAETIGRWLIDRAADVPPLPREVEIELTTQDPFPDTFLRPRGDRVPQRGPINVELVAKVAKELTAYDDSLVVLGGFGDPLLHPQFEDVLHVLREANVFGVAVRTNGMALDAGHVDSLLRHRADVLAVYLDAWSESLYADLHDGRPLSAVLDALGRLDQARSTANQVEPLVVPVLTKCNENVQEMDGFFDGWLRKLGWANIEGFSHFAGQLPDHSVMDMSPPVRRPCRRIHTRCTVLADGRVTLCDQDFKGLTAVGSLADSTLADLWQSPGFRSARLRHQDGQFTALPLCNACAEWHRP